MLSQALEITLRTLLDRNTSVALWRDDPVLSQWLDEHCGVPLVSVAQAEFLLARAASWSWESLAELPQGEALKPEGSCTLILYDLPKNQLPYALSGPGICGRLHCELPLPRSFLPHWEENCRRYPLGVDLLLIGSDHCVAIPRSIVVREKASCLT